MTDQTKPTNWCILDHPELLKQICETYNISEGKLRSDIEQFEKDVNDFEARHLTAIAESLLTTPVKLGIRSTRYD